MKTEKLYMTAILQTKTFEFLSCPKNIVPIGFKVKQQLKKDSKRKLAQ